MTLKSHECKFTASEVASLTALPILLVALFAISMHLGAKLRWLPAPLPIHDTDRTILLHQANASRQIHTAETILIGDSSCLMDISAVQLEKELNHRILNLATLSYVDLDWHDRLIKNYEEANPGRLKTIVLMMHPESLRLGSKNPYFGEVLENYLAEEDRCPPNESRIGCWLGVPIFRARIASRVFPAPLPGVYGQRYGFSWDLWDYLSQNQGSAIDPRIYRREAAEGSAEYRLAPALEKSSRAFKMKLPAGVKLLVGLTPSPESFVLQQHSQTCARILEQWSDWLNADGILKGLPYTMPDALFASSTHLAEKGISNYTAIVARSINTAGQSPPK